MATTQRRRGPLDEFLHHIVAQRDTHFVVQHQVTSGMQIECPDAVCGRAMKNIHGSNHLLIFYIIFPEFFATVTKHGLIFTWHHQFTRPPSCPNCGDKLFYNEAKKSPFFFADDAFVDFLAPCSVQEIVVQQGTRMETLGESHTLETRVVRNDALSHNFCRRMFMLQIHPDILVHRLV